MSIDISFRYYIVLKPTQNKKKLKYIFSNSNLTSTFDISFNNYHLSIFSNREIYHDPVKGIYILLKGKIYNKTAETFEYIANSYSELGPSFAKILDGAFSCILIDAKKNRLLCCTDRTGTYKTFYYSAEDYLVLSNSISVFSDFDLSIDKTALSIYLSNGHILNNRTLFEDIKVVPASSVLVFSEKEILINRYWNLNFSYSHSNKSEKKLEDELFELLTNAIKKRITQKNRLYVSLSGGNDITSVLGVLKNIGLKKIKCITYSLDNSSEKSDASVAAAIAKISGYEHKIVSSFEESGILNFFKNNAEFGNGISNICEEVHFWDNLRDDLSSDSDNLIFFGEEAYGWSKSHLQSHSDILANLKIFNLNSALILKHFIDKKNFKILKELSHSETEEISNSVPQFENKFDKLSYLYFTQKIPHVMMPWREFFPGRYIDYSNPHLDYDILDFISNLPVKFRYNKSLFINSVSRHIPDLFRINRATSSGNNVNWNSVLNRNKKRIEDEFLSFPSVLDDLIPLIKVKDRFTSYSKNSELIKKLRFYNRKLKKIIPLTVNHPLLNEQLSNEDFIKRYITLRLFLTKFKNSSLTF